MPVAPYRLFGLIGISLAVVVGLWMVNVRGLSLGVGIALTVASISAIFVVILGTRLLTGYEQIVYYHHEIGVLCFAAVVLWIMDAPFESFLDIVLVCVGCVISCLRVGCLLAGCCHGRPARHGVLYSKAHTKHGIPSCYEGVPLFPVQIIEAVLASCITGYGVYLILNASPGYTLLWYTEAYGATRFCLEFLRGDTDRPYWMGFSEAQWTSWVLTGFAGASSVAGVLPSGWYGTASFCFITVVAILTAMNRKFSPERTYALYHPCHIVEVAAVLDAAVDREQEDVRIFGTSVGLHLSVGAREGTEFYSFSGRPGFLRGRMPGRIAKLIRNLRCADADYFLIQGANGGTYHVVMREP